MPNLLVSDSIAREGIEILERAGRVDVNDKITGDELGEAIVHYDALVVRSRTRVTAGIINAGTRLRVIGRAGVGLDNIDTQEAERRGIAVVNSPASSSVSVAEHTFGLILALARLIPQADASMKRGEWAKNKFMGIELSGKTLGLIGLGRIGSLVAQRAVAFGMTVLTVDPYITPDRAHTFGATLLDSLDELLAKSDFVSIHTPLLPTTQGLIGATEFAKLKPRACLICCARGGVVDENALLVALESGAVAGVALDVFAQEPPGENSLVRHPRVIATPHIGAMTEEGQKRAAIEMAEQVVKCLEENGAG
ncbi:MAG TPA: hydroxyacid dehydrogenase [Anaerolineae bacterium]